MIFAYDSDFCKILIFNCNYCLQEEKRKFHRETERVCGLIENHLKISPKKKDIVLQEVYMEVYLDKWFLPLFVDIIYIEWFLYNEYLYVIGWFSARTRVAEFSRIFIGLCYQTARSQRKKEVRIGRKCMLISIIIISLTLLSYMIFFLLT